MKKTLCIILLSISVFSCNRKADSKNEQNHQIVKDSLSLELANIQSQGLIKGFGVAIVNKDTTLYANGFGHTTIEGTTSYRKNTLQNIASVSKTLIGISLLKAQEMGKLNIEDPVNKYLSFDVFNPIYPTDTITIKHLATHTSSIQDGDLYGQKSYILQNVADTLRAKSIPSAEGFNAPKADMDMGTFLKNFLSQKGEWYESSNYLENEPGRFYEYTNVGATLAAHIIETATGMSYSDFTENHILKPIGMNSSGWSTSKVDTSHLTQLFTVDGKQIPDYKLITYPDGGLITSVEDMAKYLSELVKGYSGNGTLLSKESYQLYFTEFLSEKNFEEERDTDRAFDDEFNSGLFIGHTPNGQIGHMGGDPGVSTFMFFDPKTKVGRLLFINSDLDKAGADEFYAIWDKLITYGSRLNQ
ncbi:MAG: serine hydrolase domain-containing protein [Bacteroidota bacterium]